MARPCKKQEERRANVVKAYIDDDLYSRMIDHSRKMAHPSISHTLIVFMQQNLITKRRRKNA